MPRQEKQTFADLKNDFAFKKTFASEESKDSMFTNNATCPEPRFSGLKD